jgi:hypothetical protein
MQGVEDNVGGHVGKTRAQVGPGVQFDRLIACFPKGCGAFTP